MITQHDVRQASARAHELRDGIEKARLRISEISDLASEAANNEAEPRVAELVDPLADNKSRDFTIEISALKRERKALAKEVKSMTAALAEVEGEAERRKSEFRTHRKATLAQAMSESIDMVREQLVSNLAFVALYDAVANGIPAGSRTPGVCTSQHVDLKEHREAIAALERQLDAEHGFT